jgi:hypothetical protein
MLVKELIATLKRLDGDLPVHIAYCRGDRGRTEVAPEADGAEVLNVHHSSYHDMDRVAGECAEETEGQQLRAVVVIR